MLYTCHKTTEIYNKLFITDSSNITELINKYKVDTIVSLLESWSTSMKLIGRWEGHLYHMPIPEKYIISDLETDSRINEIISLLKDGRRVGVISHKGHGRTGLVTAILLGKLGYEDPIAYIRENYCIGAIETEVQFEQIQRLTGLDLEVHRKGFWQ